jgi:hypothetical protein
VPFDADQSFHAAHVVAPARRSFTPKPSFYVVEFYIPPRPREAIARIFGAIGDERFRAASGTAAPVVTLDPEGIELISCGVGNKPANSRGSNDAILRIALEFFGRRDQSPDR